MKYIDLRSDTVTKPNAEMRKIIAEAEVGDDVLGDDPTVTELQNYVAEMVGMDGALFVPSGCMANTTAILSHTQPGDEVIVEKESHTFNFEAGAAASFGGVQFHTVEGIRGVYTADQIKKAIRSENVHIPPSRLLILENTHNLGGGTIYPLDEIRKITDLAKQNGIKTHLDGARVFNASVATGVPVKQYAKYFDSMMFCFSKGLGAPIGSIVIGSKEFIKKAYRVRKMLGGGMRQVGILAAAARYALDNNVARLAEDHENAKLLAEGLSKIDGFEIDPNHVETNIIVVDVSKSKFKPDQIAEQLKVEGVLIIPFGEKLIRAVTHLDVSRDEIQRAVSIAQRLFV